MANSNYFTKIFTSDFKEKNQNQIVMNELKLNEFVQILNIIYNRKSTIITGKYFFYINQLMILLSLN